MCPPTPRERGGRRSAAFRCATPRTRERASMTRSKVRFHSSSKISITGEVHPFSACPGASEALRSGGARLAAMRTVLHGDVTSKNIFLRHRSESMDVGFICFQWTGFGLPGTEIAHFMLESVELDGLSTDGVDERALLDAFSAASPKRSAPCRVRKRRRKNYFHAKNFRYNMKTEYSISS